MKSLQMSILALVLIVVACAMAFTALKTASDLWYGALYTFTAVLLLAALIAARFRRGNEKAFWFGFAVFGWGFFILGLGPWPTLTVDEPSGMGIVLNQNLLTSRVILFLVPYLRTNTNELGAIDKITTNTIGIAHLLVTLAIAICGGLIAILIRRRRGRLVSIKSLTILAALAVATAYASSSKFGRPSAGRFSESAFKNEPSLRELLQQHPDAIAYRLLWEPSFHHPVCVRIERAGDGTKLSAEVLDGKGGYAWGQVAIHQSIALSAEQFSELDRHMEQAAFWTMPADERKDVVVHDGDPLVLEGVKNGTYHIVRRMMPDRAYTELCGHMLDLTGLKIRAIWEEYHPNNNESEM
jgi:hypothetical protein